jgi:hypothetical protein
MDPTITPASGNMTAATMIIKRKVLVLTGGSLFCIDCSKLYGKEFEKFIPPTSHFLNIKSL